MELVRGQKLGRYEIQSLLGAGGMGVVYRAWDAQLGRNVAVKVVREDAGASPSRIRRFEQEARAVARLSHPNILDIHDFGADGGITYAVTELLQGETVRDRLLKGRIPLKKALAICADVADGLAAAHSEGIIHRDVKPSNIFITDTGHVKILDFGLAQLREAWIEEPTSRTETHSTTHTRTGGVAGTVGYMAPEQIQGRGADSKSDIFALGCVMYEILTNRRAFTGATTGEVAHAILGKDPPPMSGIRPEIPGRAESVVRRCLEKQPGERYESARDVAFALRDLSTDLSSDRPSLPPQQSRVWRRLSWVAGSLVMIAIATWVAVPVRSPPPIPEQLRVVVMPIEAPGGDHHLGLVAAGLTDMIIDGLSLVERTEGGIDWVVPRRKMLEATNHSMSGYHRMFNNTLAITGSLQRSGALLILSLEVVDPATERRLRSLRIEAPPGNVDALQSSPVLRIAESLAITIDSATRDRLTGSNATMVEVFDNYVEARGILATAQDVQEVEDAVSRLNDAVTLDPLFAAGHVALGQAALAGFEMSGNDRWIESGLESAGRATRLAGRVAAAWRTVGSLHRAHGDHQSALAAFDTAVGLAPNHADGWIDKGLAHEELGEFDDAERSFRRALYLRPGYWPDHRTLAQLYIARGEYEEAVVQLRQVVDCAPLFALGHVMLGGVNWYLEKTDTARRQFERSLEIEPTYAGLSNLGTLHFQASRFGDAAVLFKRALELDPSSHTLWGHLGYAYKYGDQPDLAESAFRKAVQLAEADRSVAHDDLALAADLADYYAMLDDRARGLALIEAVAAASPTDPQLIAWIAEVFDDLGERDRALVWVGRAFESGIPPSRFEDRPTLRGLVADERFQKLVTDTGAP